ncbi:putative epoxidase LasC [Enhygromyxa salina]|uniref:Putative epoxidase LasC n=1 Tax=Enhygromyxa salina TaxID=215803 RepID=A0A2S9XDC7_9BACT|nr:NAD(P)-binding protein [Enhygromyxa salina]PRP90691.1 putative epoxidase LasC [Enhygromyxa salina]
MSHAIVMGGSIAGLCAAAALAKNFDRVTVLERDPEPGFEPGKRRGVPQGGHAHVLLRRGQEIMDGLFPGAFDALARGGSFRKDLGTAFRWFQFGEWKMRSELGVDAWYQSRPFLEHHLRQSLMRNPKVELRFEAGIEQPLHARGKVYGVRMRDGSELAGDLVVDATGRGSRSTTWLRDWGYGAVPEQRVKIGMGYVSGVFEPAADSEPVRGAVGVYQHAPVSKRLGLAFPLEGGRVMVTLCGYHGDHAPSDIEGFRAWAGTLLRPDISDVLAGATLIGKLRKSTFPEQIRRCYDRMLRLPNRYLVLGDAMCCFDPTFGQGMVVSAIQASELAAFKGFRGRPNTSTRRLQRRLSRTTVLPFTMTANEAHRWPETTGWTPALGGVQRAYIGKVYDGASHDPVIYRALVETMHFLAPPTALFRPRLAWRVLTAQAPEAKPEVRPEVRSPAKPAAAAFVGELSSGVRQAGP